MMYLLPHVYLMIYDVSDPTKSMYVKYVFILEYNANIYVGM